MHSMCSNIGSAKKKKKTAHRGASNLNRRFASRSEGGTSKFVTVFKSGECPAKLRGFKLQGQEPYSYQPPEGWRFGGD